jgi:hypothetical protein
VATHWFLKKSRTEFHSTITTIIDKASVDLGRPDARVTLGDEHDQCQYLFTKMYTLMQERVNDLTHAILRCSKIPAPIVELRYYRSRIKRGRKQSNAQFIEGETGADFALVLDVNLPNVLQAQRSVLGQAKILDGSSLALDNEQLERILQVGGPESAAYLVWGKKKLPSVLSAENVAAFIRTQGGSYLSTRILPFARPIERVLFGSLPWSMVW